MIISSQADIPRFLSLIIDITTNAIYPTTLCGWFLFDLEQKVIENVQQAFDFCLSVPSAARYKGCTMILSALPFEALKCKDRISPLMNLPFRLLRRRLLARPSTVWDVVDHFFLEAKNLPILIKAELVEILGFARGERFEGHQVNIFSCTVITLPTILSEGRGHGIC